MNLITFGFSEKGTPVFLNQEPYQQVGTMYLMKAGNNSIIGITLDDKILKPNTHSNGAARRSKKSKTETAEAAPKRRGRKPVQAKEKPARRARKKKEEKSEVSQ